MGVSPRCPIGPIKGSVDIAIVDARRGGRRRSHRIGQKKVSVNNCRITRQSARRREVAMRLTLARTAMRTGWRVARLTHRIAEGRRRQRTRRSRSPVHQCGFGGASLSCSIKRTWKLCDYGTSRSRLTDNGRRYAPRGSVSCNVSGDRCTRDALQQQHDIGTAVRSTEWVGRFQPFRINGLEMVDQICPRWNPLTSWMRRIEDFQRAA